MNFLLTACYMKLAAFNRCSDMRRITGVQPFPIEYVVLIHCIYIRLCDPEKLILSIDLHSTKLNLTYVPILNTNSY